MNQLKVNQKLKSCFSRFLQKHLSKNYTTQSPVVNLAHDSFDKYNSDKSLIIAHGLFASKFSWRSVAKAINEKTRYKVLTIDLRNHADSPYTESMNYVDMANDLNHFIQNTVLNSPNKPTEIAVMGHSMGGKASMTLALLHPNSIDKLIIADVSPNTSPSLDSIKSYIEVMSKIDFKACKTIYEARKLAEKSLIEIPSLQKDRLMRAFILTRIAEFENGIFSWNFNIKSINENIENIMQFPNVDKKYEKSTLFMGGEKSNYITEKDQVDIDRYFPNNKIVKILNAGHVIHLDNPRDTITTIDEYLNSSK